MRSLWGRLRGFGFLELFAAAGFAITQPLLAVYGRSPDEFVFLRSARWQIVVFALGVTLVVPIVWWLLELVVSLVSARAADVVHLVGLGLLAALLAVIVLQRAVDPGPVLPWVVGLAAGVGFAVLLARVDWVRSWLRFGALAPPVFVALFLFSSSVSPLISEPDVAVAGTTVGTRQRPVVLVVFDEWPTASFVDAEGAVDPARFPNLARLTRDATWYRNSTTVTNSTWHAVPTILTGRMPAAQGLPEAFSHPESLFTLLAPSHRMRVSETVTRVCPTSLCQVALAGRLAGLTDLARSAVDTYGNMLSGAPGAVTSRFEEREISEAVSGARASERDAREHPLDLGVGMATGGAPERLETWLAGMRAGEPATLHVLHVLLPHVPYHYLPDGRRYDDPDPELGKDGDRWVDAPGAAQLGHERMLLQAAYVDALVGRIVERLRATGLYDRSMLVVTADHGIAFDPGGAIRGLDGEQLTQSERVQIMWQPLFVKLPGQRAGGTSDANVMTIDIVPTIADALGVRIPWRVDGVPAGTRPAGDTTKLFAPSKVNPFGVEIQPVERIDGTAGLATMLGQNLDAVAPPAGPDDALALYRVGPHGDLVGRRVADLPAGAARGDAIDLDGTDALRDVDPAAPVLPALVLGSAGADGDVVVAVNGRVAGVSSTFPSGGRPRRIGVVVPPALLRAGANDVRAYWLDAAGALHPAGG